MINIVIPMAGAGKRFLEKGYTFPKPLISVHQYSMIEVVIRNLQPKQPHRFIFVVQKEHKAKYHLEEKLKKYSPGCVIIETDGLTEGAACTVLLAKSFIDNETPLMIANCDQWVDIDINQYLYKMEKEGLDGLIMTMRASDPKWSFVKLDQNMLVIEVAEKKVISNEATVGIYNYSKGKKFVEFAENMIKKEIRVNNEFYIAPVYNEMIKNRLRVGIYNIGADFSGMYGLGTPLDLEKFINHEKSFSI